MADAIGNLTIGVSRWASATITTPEGDIVLIVEHAGEGACTIDIQGPSLNEGVGGMLYLRAGDEVALRPDVIVKVRGTERGQCRLHIRAPRSYRISRKDSLETSLEPDL